VPASPAPGPPAVAEPPAGPEPTAPGPPTMRERYRSQVRQEVKQAALSQLAESGPAGLSISAIGKSLGVSGPALYRYFASRDELLTELVIDAYADLAAALAAAGQASPEGATAEPRERLANVLRAYRSWAVAQPHRYRLLFGPPLPGYDAHAGRLVEAAQVAMNVLLDVLGPSAAGPPAPGTAAPGTAAPPGQPLASQVLAWAETRGLDADPATMVRAVLIWSGLHGFVGLEIAGNFASMGLDPGALFEIQLAALTG
jgi:AcrR family transcriptional regulator